VEFIVLSFCSFHRKEAAHPLACLHREHKKDCIAQRLSLTNSNKNTTDYSFHVMAQHHSNYSLLDVVIEQGLEPFFTKLLQPMLSPVVAAASNGNTLEVRRLLEQENGNDVNEKDSHGRTPLIHAILNGHLETFQFLLEKGADFSNTNANDYHYNYCGWTPLIHASAAGHYEMVRLLLEKNQRDEEPDSSTRSTSFINDKTNLGSTALSMASYNGHFRVACLLLHHGADVWIANANGKTPADLAKGECKRIDWRAFMQAYMITPISLSTIIDNAEEITWTVIDEQQHEQCEQGKEQESSVVMTREMMQSILQEQQDLLIQRHKDVLHAEMAALREAMMQQQQQEMAAIIRQENATLRDMLQTLIQQQQQEQHPPK
jgi:Ankyrin repeats (3 copies)/Ankyrin repeats (many copies)